jgi:lactoylglutathione lyase
MLKLNKIDHVNVMVKNIDETVKFYSEVFGFTVKENGVSQTSGNLYAIIGISDKGLLAIYEDPKFDKQKIGNINHFGFHVDDFDDALIHLKELNVKVADYGVVNYENSRSVYIFDPNGIEIELSEKFGGAL